MDYGLVTKSLGARCTFEEVEKSFVRRWMWFFYNQSFDLISRGQNPLKLLYYIMIPNTISLPYKEKPTNTQGKFEMLTKFVKCKVWTLMLLTKILIRCGCDQFYGHWDCGHFRRFEETCILHESLKNNYKMQPFKTIIYWAHICLQPPYM
jgi:hypothetical protein